MPPSLADLDWPVRTERLLIRLCQPVDAEALFALRVRPEVARWANSVPHDLEEWRGRFHNPEIAPHVLTAELGEYDDHHPDGRETTTVRTTSVEGDGGAHR